jgi:hypothetical protein
LREGGGGLGKGNDARDRNECRALRPARLFDSLCRRPLPAEGPSLASRAGRPHRSCLVACRQHRRRMQRGFGGRLRVAVDVRGLSPCALPSRALDRGRWRGVCRPTTATRSALGVPVRSKCQSRRALREGAGGLPQTQTDAGRDVCGYEPLRDTDATTVSFDVPIPIRSRFTPPNVVAPDSAGTGRPSIRGCA